jgi:hypothetical protein
MRAIQFLQNLFLFLGSNKSSLNLFNIMGPRNKGKNIYYFLSFKQKLILKIFELYFFIYIFFYKKKKKKKNLLL